ncbi:hypothetical protein GDN83_09035 [Gordonia jinghuaiqii]|uniref:ESX-1 secretion-associated protein n=2 Tax=Gordonia jinghuaiqii TaxID=2758710 RepID=A0A7D7R477_9ACTN|nr:hypothetical protein [Gordonia jinghuaiqii]QMT02532.1 hypothetical protein H1R19_05100 [Gordonia jinghuaiqii]
MTPRTPAVPTTPATPTSVPPSTTPPRHPMPAEPGPVPAPPGEPTIPSARFGILPSEVSDIAAGWRSQGDAVGRADFSAFAAITGTGSRTLAAARSIGGPAQQCTDSIGTRLTALGDALSTFNSRAQETDGVAADRLRGLSER